MKYIYYTILVLFTIYTATRSGYQVGYLNGRLDATCEHVIRPKGKCFSMRDGYK